MSSTAYQAEKFIAFRAYDAIWKTHDNEETIVLEIRTKLDRTVRLFTNIDGKEVSTTSISSLVLMHPHCEYLSISHHLPILWNGVNRRATLIETFGKHQFSNPETYVKLSLSVDDNVYTTPACISFNEAMSELHDFTGSSVLWRFQTCFDCKFSRPAFIDPTYDRDELRCYRDVPEAFQKIHQKSKFAPQEDIFSGEYFVDAFHRCAAWQPNL